MNILIKALSKKVNNNNFYIFIFNNYMLDTQFIKGISIRNNNLLVYLTEEKFYIIEGKRIIA